MRIVIQIEWRDTNYQLKLYNDIDIIFCKEAVAFEDYDLLLPITKYFSMRALKYDNFKNAILKHSFKNGLIMTLILTEQDLCDFWDKSETNGKAFCYETDFEFAW